MTDKTEATSPALAEPQQQDVRQGQGLLGHPLLPAGLCALLGLVAALGWVPVLVSAKAPPLQWLVLALVLALSITAALLQFSQRSAAAARALEDEQTRIAAIQALRRAAVRVGEGDLAHLPPEMDMDEEWRELSLAVRAATRQSRNRARAVQHASSAVTDAAGALATACARLPAREALGKWLDASHGAEAALAGWDRWQASLPPQDVRPAHADAAALTTAWRAARLRVEDMGSRSRRLVDGAGEMQVESRGLVDLVERMGVLAVQAALHAARLGDAGQGVAVVAENMNALSNDIMTSVRRVAALVEVAGTDMEGVRRVASSLLEGVDDGTRVAELLGEEMEAAQATSTAMASALSRAQAQARETSESMGPLAAAPLRTAIESAQSAHDGVLAAASEIKVRAAKLDAQTQEWKT